MADDVKPKRLSKKQVAEIEDAYAKAHPTRKEVKKMDDYERMVLVRLRWQTFQIKAPDYVSQLLAHIAALKK